MRTFHLFISHSWAYSDAYEKLLSLLNQRGHFDFKNFSVPKDDPIHNANNDLQLYRAIEGQILPSSVVIILAGVYATHSKWINHEIEIAKRLRKPIIAVQPWGAEKTSKIVKDNADKIVGWNTESLVSAIRELA